MINKLKDLSIRLGRRRLLLDSKSAQSKRAVLLYDYIRSTDTPTIDGAGVVLSCTPSSIILRKTTHYLEQVLLDNILMVRPGDITSEDSETIKKYVWKLIGIGAGQLFNLYSKLLLPFLEEAFALAEEHGLIEAAKTASSYLAIITVTRAFDQEKHLYYKAKNDYYERLFLDYQLIRTNLREIELGLGSKDRHQEKLQDLYRLWVQSIQAEALHGHPRISLLKRLIRLRIFFLEENHEQTAKLATEAINWIKQAPKYLQGEETGFILFLSQAYLISDNFTIGYPYLWDLLNTRELPQITRGKLLETSCLLSMRTGHYQEAEIAFVALRTWNNYSHQPGRYPQHLFRAYLWLLYQTNQLRPTQQTGSQPLNRKSIRAIVSDGNYPTTRINQLHYYLVSLIYFLSRKKYKLAKTSFRALPPPPRIATRHRLLQKMLELLFSQNLHRVAVERHTKSLLAKLNKLPVTSDAITNYEEILPFETIWELILAQLGTKRIKIR